MSTNTRITRSKGESDGLSLPMRMRPTRKETILGKDGGTALNTTFNVGTDQHQQMLTQMPQLSPQSSQANPVRRTETPAPMLPPGPHRPLTPHMPLPASPTSGSQPSQLSAPLFKEDRYSSTSEEETEADAKVTLINGRNQPNRMFAHNSTTERPMSTPMTTDYTTQGDSNQVLPSTPNLFMSTATGIKFLGTNNFFIPDGSDRRTHQTHNKVFHAGYLEKGNNAYLLELPALEKMLNTRKFLMDDTAFLCSPADVPGPRKVQLQDKDITTDIRQKFKELCDKYGEAFSKNNEDIGRTKLVKMDIDTGDSPPVSSRPYTLPLKHYEWVQREIESLERAGVITKSMSKWASPIVVVPKKSAPGEPPKRRLCVDFRKVNELQQEVITAGKTKGQISIHPLPKIDEMYAKLKGTKVFSSIDLRSG